MVNDPMTKKIPKVENLGKGEGIKQELELNNASRFFNKAK